MIAGLALSTWLIVYTVRADDSDETTDSVSESSREMSEASETKRSARRKGVKASASASGMMSGSAAGRSMGGGVGAGQGQSSAGAMGPSFGGALGNADSSAAVQGRMTMRLSISTDDEEDEPKPDTVDPYVPGGPGGNAGDDVHVMRRMEGGRRITTVERTDETITITDSPSRIVVHRLDCTVDPPVSRYVAATSPKALAAKDATAYELFDRYVVKTPGPGRAAQAEPGLPATPGLRGLPTMPGVPARAGSPEMPRTGIPEMDRMLHGIFDDQQ